MSDCFVYVISQECADPKEDKVHVKIGVSGNPAVRLAQLQTGAPFKLRLQAAYRLPSRMFALRVEQRFHRTNELWATSGEWSKSPPFYAAEELALYCVEAWIEDGYRLLDVAEFCDRAGIPCSVFASAISDFVDHPTLSASCL